MTRMINGEEIIRRTSIQLPCPLFLSAGVHSTKSIFDHIKFCSYSFLGPSRLLQCP